MTPRVPLGARVLGVILVGVLLAAVPGYLVVRWATERAVVRATMLELASQTESVARLLGGAGEGELEAAVERVITTVPTRVTIVDARGNVLGDTVAEGRGPLENHADRPEIRQAMAGGQGTARRYSQTLQADQLYAARRFPEDGPARGVVRLAIPEKRISAAIANARRILDLTGAVVLTASLLAGLAASLAVARPLRRLLVGVQALSGGDLSHTFDAERSDELGQLADALGEMATELRTRLLEVGADHAAFRAVIDEAQVGVVLFDPDRAPEYLNGAARTLFSLTPVNELEALAELARHPNQAATIDRVVASGAGEEHRLVVPWARKLRVSGRFVPVPHEGGRPGVALLVHDDEAAARRIQVFAGLERWAGTVRQLVGEARGGELQAEGLLIASEMDRVRARNAPIPDAEELRAVPAATLIAGVVGDARPLATARGITLESDARVEDLTVSEVDGRVETAIRQMLVDAVRNAQPGSTVRLMARPEGQSIRVDLRHDGPPIKTKLATMLVGAIGGEVGQNKDGERGESWLILLRG